MSTLPLRQKLVEIARRDVGQTETSRNRGPAIKKFWPATSYPEGYQNRDPYCAAAVCYWVREWLKDTEVQKAFGKSAAQLESWRCKSAGAWAWQDWAERKGLLVLSDSPKETLHTGDLFIFDISHIGIVADDFGGNVINIEANTNAGGSRDGDGIWQKTRPRLAARAFVRLLP